MASAPYLRAQISHKSFQRFELKSLPPASVQYDSKTSSNWDDSRPDSESSITVDNEPTATVILKIPRPPPTIENPLDRHKNAPYICSVLNPAQDEISAKVASNGDVLIQTKTPNIFRQVQKLFHDCKVPFVTSNLPEDRTLKVVARGIPTIFLKDDVIKELANIGFTVELVKRFGTSAKPMLICLIILVKDEVTTEIYEITELFHMKIKIESYKKSGPSQCFACQHFGHGSSKCDNLPRCVKCAGNHNASDCKKLPDQEPTCCNCGEKHTANFSEEVHFNNSYRLHYLRKRTWQDSAKPLSAHNAQNPPKVSYSAAASTEIASNPSKNSLELSKVLLLLQELLISISTSNNLKDMMIKVISSFISNI